MSQRQNTNNPIPSNELADLNDNTLIIDEFTNSKSDYTQDRFGNKFRTIKKYTRDLEDLIVEVSKDSSMPKSGGSFSGDIFINNVPVLKQGDRGLFSTRQTLVYITTNEQLSNMLSGERLFVKDNQKAILPSTTHGYLIKMGARNISLGGYFIFNEHLETGRIWKGNQSEKTSRIVWHELITSVNIHNYLAVGIPQPWPTLTPPSGWLKCNGAVFDKVRYPKLAIAYPSGKLPDLRGEFIRGLDDGRGVDSTRAILSEQKQQIVAHKHVGGWGESITDNDSAYMKSAAPFGASTYNSRYYLGSAKSDWDNRLYYTNDGTSDTNWPDINVANLVGKENRPRNIAFLYIVKAE